jgi:hypothetical protein
MRRIFSLLALAAVFSVAAFADVRLPDTPKPTPARSKKVIESDLTIRIDKNAKEARLLIPKSQIKQLRAELEELDDDSTNTAFLTFSRTQTIVSGLFLSLAFVFGGVWLTRKGKNDPKPKKIAAAVAALFLLGGFAGLVYANMGPPPEARSITSKLFDRKVFVPYLFASGKIRIETTDETDRLELVVPYAWENEQK